MSGETLNSVREMGLRMKFEQNESFRWILLLTRNAELRRFRRQTEARPDIELMNVRAHLFEQYSKSHK